MTEIVYIGLGSNLSSPKKQLANALNALAALPRTQSIVSSALYRSSPLGPQDQNDYINAVTKLETELAPLELLDQLQMIEQTQGRIRKAERWGPRTLDLDLLLFGNKVIKHQRLIVPHYGLKERAFVLFPLIEIAPNLVLPDGSSINQLVERLTEQGITKL